MQGEAKLGQVLSPRHAQKTSIVLNEECWDSGASPPRPSFLGRRSTARPSTGGGGVSFSHGNVFQWVGSSYLSPQLLEPFYSGSLDKLIRLLMMWIHKVWEDGCPLQAGW